MKHNADIIPGQWWARREHHGIEGYDAGELGATSELEIRTPPAQLGNIPDLFVWVRFNSGVQVPMKVSQIRRYYEPAIQR